MIAHANWAAHSYGIIAVSCAAGFAPCMLISGWRKCRWDIQMWWLISSAPAPPPRHSRRRRQLDSHHVAHRVNVWLRESDYASQLTFKAVRDCQTAQQTKRQLKSVLPVHRCYIQQTVSFQFFLTSDGDHTVVVAFRFFRNFSLRETTCHFKFQK